MKVFAIATVARQVNGEFVFIKIEKAFKKASKADDFAKSLAKKYAETINTPQGPIQCVCERGVFEVEVDEEE
jgi:hypothetical protein